MSPKGIVIEMMKVPLPLLGKIACLVGVTLAVSCGPAMPKESDRMRVEVGPQILAWARSPSPELNLRSLEALRAFDYFCYVWEYQNLNRIERALGPMDSYSGSSAIYVPELQTAIIGVQKRQAHYALLSLRSFSIGRGGDKECVPVQKARLVKEAPTKSGELVVRLTEVGQRGTASPLR